MNMNCVDMKKVKEVINNTDGCSVINRGCRYSLSFRGVNIPNATKKDVVDIYLDIINGVIKPKNDKHVCEECERSECIMINYGE